MFKRNVFNGAIWWFDDESLVLLSTFVTGWGPSTIGSSLSLQSFPFPFDSKVISGFDFFVVLSKMFGLPL